jgi:hypothetical protein
MSTNSKKRWNIPTNSGKSRYIAPLAYRNKLMRPGQTAEPGTVLYFTVTSYLNEIAHNNLISKYAVVSDVGADHDKVVVSDYGLCPGMHARMDGNLFVKGVSITYQKFAYFVFKAQIQCLWSAANNTIRKKMIVFSDFNILANHHIGLEYSACSY